MTAAAEEIASRARRIVRAADRAVLSTATAGEGWPYGSLVLTACDFSARPLMLISELAEHTKNLHADARASLLFDDTAGLDDPLTGARVTVLGRPARCDDDRLKARYLARHPSAADYAEFGDFALYRMTVERVHIVAGFGVIHWIDDADFLFDAVGTEDLTGQEAGIVAHMNADHGDAIELYAAGLAGRVGTGWKMTGLDPEGFDLRRRGEVARVDFEAPVCDADAARRALIGLLERARETAVERG